MTAGGPSLARLRARVEDAIVDLGAIRSSDPAARAAVLAVHLTAHTLRELWVPALDQAPPRDAA